MGLVGAAAAGISNFGNVNITKPDLLNGGHGLGLVCCVPCILHCVLRANIIRHH